MLLHGEVAHNHEKHDADLKLVFWRGRGVFGNLAKCILVLLSGSHLSDCVFLRTQGNLCCIHEDIVYFEILGWSVHLLLKILLRGWFLPTVALSALSFTLDVEEFLRFRKGL